MSLQFTQAQLDDIRNDTHSDSREPQSTVREREEECEARIGTIDRQIRQLEVKIDYLENQSRRNNLRIDGIPENRRETWSTTESEVIQLITKDLKLPAPQIE